jgi:hypothetical protein
VHGQEVVEHIFWRLAEPSGRYPLVGFVVWLPMVEGDAEGTQQPLRDPRMRGWWDGGRTVGRLFAPLLKLPRKMAWDVYLVYAPGIEWGEVPPIPTDWMHQLRDADPARCLDEGRLGRILEEMLHG